MEPLCHRDLFIRIWEKCFDLSLYVFTYIVTDIKCIELLCRYFRVSGDRVLYDMPEAASRPLQYRYLTKRDCYLLHRGQNEPLYIWIGSLAMEDEVNHAISRARVSLNNDVIKHYVDRLKLL